MKWSDLVGAAGGFFDSAKWYVLGIAITGVVSFVTFQHMTIEGQQKKIEAQAGKLADNVTEIATLNGLKAGLEKSMLDGDAIASIAAKTCKSVITFRVNNQTESKAITNAPDDAAAVRAYDDLMCGRPEARGHPKCAAPAAETGG